MEIAELVNKLASSLTPKDDLQRIEYEVRLEELIDDVRARGILDTELFLDISFLGIPFLQFFMRYKNISSEEARAFIAYGYVTFFDFLTILNFGMGGNYHPI